MRRAAFVPLVLAALAACADQPTLPGPLPPPNGIRASTSGTGASLVVSAPRTIAWNEGGLTWQMNLPHAEVGGGRVVWQDRINGPTEVHSYDLRAGTRWQITGTNAEVAEANTSGRWTVWTDEQQILYLHDAQTRFVWTIGTGWSPRVAPDGRVAYIHFERPDGRNARNPNVAIYDPATRTSRVLTQYNEATEVAHAPDIDGDVVAWSVSPGYQAPATSGVRMMSLASGEVREIVRVRGYFVGPVSVSGSRIAWADSRTRANHVYLYDAATGEQRQISSAGARPTSHVRISGDLIVWEDTRRIIDSRNAHRDVYLYDLASGTEMALAASDLPELAPAVDGQHVVWTQRANDRWEIRVATVGAVTLQSLADAVDAMAASGEISNRGAAESLRAFLAQATRAHDAGDAAGKRAALERFRKHVQQLAGKQVSASAAARLTAMSDTLLQALGS